ncbi:hypothetical protein NFI96_020873 [Prochilodus magdalenae]|nr:hypothetical protein NFI96_020873 [Prochilodus magdalenae]
MFFCCFADSPTLIVAPLPYVADLTQSDQYGCVHWQPEEPPFGGNDETLEEQRKQMLQLHSYEGMTGADREEVCKLMEVTYYHQRQDINAVSHSSLSSLKSSWPYLFCLKVFSTHFQLLTDITLLTGIMEGFQAKGKRILKFFEEKPTNNEVCAIVLKSGQESSLVSCILLLLMAHFKEKFESLFLEADVAATAADIQRTAALPDSPRLIIQGDKMNLEKWMQSVEGKLVLRSSQGTFFEDCCFICHLLYLQPGVSGGSSIYYGIHSKVTKRV